MEAIEKRFWQSKKWWVMAITLVLVSLSSALGIDLPVDAIAGVAASYIIGQGWLDGKARSAKLLADAAPKK